MRGVRHVSAQRNLLNGIVGLCVYVLNAEFTVRQTRPDSAVCIASA